MAKITIIISLTILCLFSLSSTLGEDHWKARLQKRLVQISLSGILNNFIGGQTSPSSPFAGTTAKVTPTIARTTARATPTIARTTARVTPSTTARTTARVTPTTTARVAARVTPSTTARATARVTPSTTARTTARVTPSTTARTTARVTVPSTASPSSSFTTFQNEALAQTNKYRAAHCAPNLILNATLNGIAQAYANKLVQIGQLVHSNNGYGENLYYVSYGQPNDISSIKGSTPVESWYGEEKDYDYGSPSFSSKTGHFTQLVWINTKQLGMGIACTSDKRKCYMVANYSPPGNYANQFPANVKPVSSCN